MYSEEIILAILKNIGVKSYSDTNSLTAKTGILQSSQALPANHQIKYNAAVITAGDATTSVDSMTASCTRGTDDSDNFNCSIIANVDDECAFGRLCWPVPQGLTGCWALSGNFGGCYFSLYRHNTTKAFIAAHEYAGSTNTQRADTGTLGLTLVDSIKSDADTGDYGIMCLFGGKYIIAFAKIGGDGKVSGIGKFQSGNLPT